MTTAVRLVAVEWRARLHMGCLSGSAPTGAHVAAVAVTVVIARWVSLSTGPPLNVARSLMTSMRRAHFLTSSVARTRACCPALAFARSVHCCGTWCASVCGCSSVNSTIQSLTQRLLTCGAKSAMAACVRSLCPLSWHVWLVVCPTQCVVTIAHLCSHRPWRCRPKPSQAASSCHSCHSPRQIACAHCAASWHVGI